MQALAAAFLVMAGVASGPRVDLTTDRVNSHELAIGADRAGLLGIAVEDNDGSGDGGVSCVALPIVRGYVVRRGASGAIGRLRRLTNPLEAGPVRAGREFVALTSRARRLSPDCAPVVDLIATQLTSRGSARLTTTLERSTVLWDVAAVAARDDGAALAWIGVRGKPANEAATLRLSTVRRGQVSRPVTIVRRPGAFDDAPISDVAIAATPAGYLISWAEPGRVRAIDVSAAGSLGRVQTLGPADDRSTVLTGASRDGRVVVAWTSQDGGEERGRPLLVRAAIRAPGARGFDRSQKLSRDGVAGDPWAKPAMTVDPGGAAALVWDEAAESDSEVPHPVHVAVAGANGRFIRTSALAELGAPTPDADALAIAFNHNRKLLIAYGDSDGVHLVHRSPDGRRAESEAPVTSGSQPAFFRTRFATMLRVVEDLGGRRWRIVISRAP